MSRKTTLLGTLAVVLLAYSPAQAGYAGTLRDDLPWTLKVWATNGAGVWPTAVTIYYVGRGLDVEAILTVPRVGPEGAITYELAKPARVKRIIIEVDGPTCTVAGFEGSQSLPGVGLVHSFRAESLDLDCEGSSDRVVLDVVAAP